MANTPKKFRKRWKRFDAALRGIEGKGWSVGEHDLRLIADRCGLCCNAEYEAWSDKKVAHR